MKLKSTMTVWLAEEATTRNPRKEKNVGSECVTDVFVMKLPIQRCLLTITTHHSGKKNNQDVRVEEESQGLLSGPSTTQ
jgi:hypothetical protein